MPNFPVEVIEINILFEYSIQIKSALTEPI